jgi:hypothetical protein
MSRTQSQSHQYVANQETSHSLLYQRSAKTFLTDLHLPLLGDRKRFKQIRGKGSVSWEISIHIQNRLSKVQLGEALMNDPHSANPIAHLELLTSIICLQTTFP